MAHPNESGRLQPEEEEEEEHSSSSRPMPPINIGLGAAGNAPGQHRQQNTTTAMTKRSGFGAMLLSCAILFGLLGCARLLRRTVAQDPPGMAVTTAGSSDKCWIFTHLNKSGGTTVKKILEGMWGPRYLFYRDLAWEEEDEAAALAVQRLEHSENLNVIVGAYSEGLRRLTTVDSKCQWLTMFRHPVSRMVSAYYYCKQHTKDQLCASNVLNPQEASLISFAKHWGNFAVRQLALSFIPTHLVMEYAQTEEARQKLPILSEGPSSISPWYLVKMYLDSQVSSSEYADVPDAALHKMLQPVQDLLRDNYAAVGIIEEFDTTMALFDAALDMPGVKWRQEFDLYGASNVDRRWKSEETETLEDAWTNSEIKKYMWLDLLLYEHAVVVFKQQAELYNLE